MAQLCGYGCGKPWVHWAGSKLQGHARCRFSTEEAEELLRRYQADPRLTVAKLAREVGESRCVVVAALRVAEKRRGEAAARAGRSRAKHRERIGNAVPVGAARAIAESLLTALLAAATGKWVLGATGIWVRRDMGRPAEMEVGDAA